MNTFKKDDQVIVISGAHKGLIGKIIKVLPKSSTLIIDGLTMKKHVKPTQNSQGGIKDLHKAIQWSNVMHYSEKKKMKSKLKVTVNGKTKTRSLKKTKEDL
ncbi:50S ribosomal protein L24 [Candidatus Marinamargulisbacteria bacterium SCGC AG-343-D04]|nr:50S ribosomal protein L24 [Candidatus Marinamargulisbacteria bacterium SCGC AG-343-D04]